MASVKKDILFNTFSNFLQFGTRWLLNVVLARTFPPGFYGQFTLIYSTSTIFSSLFAFGSNLFLLHKARNDVSVLIRSIILSTILFLIVATFILLFFPNYLIVSLLGFVLALNVNLFFYYKGIGWFNKEAKLYLLFSIALLGLIFLIQRGVIVSIEFIILLLIAINAFVFLLGFIVLCSSVGCKGSVRGAISSLIKVELRERFIYGIHEILSILFKNLEFILLGIYAGSKPLGEYRAIYNLIFPFYTIATVTSQVLLSRLSVLADNKKRLLLKKFVILTGIIGTILVVILCKAYSFILQIFYDSRFTDKTYRFLYLLILANFFVFLIKSNFEVALTAKGKQAFRVKILIFSILLLILIDFFAIKLNGVIGHAMAVLMVNVFIFFVYLNKVLSLHLR